MDYIRRRRIACAAELLANTGCEITHIATQYQFDSLDGFSRAFKRYCGTSPGKYRRNNKLMNT
jgi:AraC family transcriptional regulator